MSFRFPNPAIFLSIPLLISAAPLSAASAKKTSAPPSAPSSSLEKMAQTIAKNLKDQGIRAVAVLNFAFEDGKASSGCAVVPAEVVRIWDRAKPFSVAAPETTMELLAQKRIEPSAPLTLQSAAALGDALKADAAVFGTLREGKKQVEVHALAVRVSDSRILSQGFARIPKTWKDPVAGCGSIQWAPLAATPSAPQGSPQDIQVVFADPWWNYEKIGTLTWDFCKPGGRAPTVNDAMVDLKKRAWEAGGRGLVIRKNDPHPANPKVLEITAEVIR